jgi:hypothetical protein
MEKDNQPIKTAFSLDFLALVIGAFVWLWSSALPKTSSKSANAKYVLVDISTEKQTIEDLFNGRDNLSTMPLVAPAADKVSRDNPFVNP